MSNSDLPPPRAPFFIGGDRADGATSPLGTAHSRNSSSDAAAPNPFSPPASVLSFSMPGSTPGTPTPRAQTSPTTGYFPDQPVSSRASASTYSAGSRPTTAMETSNPFATNPPTRNNSGLRLREAFTAPSARPFTVYGVSGASAPVKHNRARSTMLREDEPLVKPWLEKDAADPEQKKTKKDARIAYAITWGIIFLGVVGSAVRCYFGWQSVNMLDESKLCMVMDEDFSGGEEALFGPGGKWNREIEVGGFGNGQFEMTTDSNQNSYVRDGKLHIVPTLTTETIPDLETGTFNATGCTFLQTADTKDDYYKPEFEYKACGVVANTSTGVIIPPVRSARLTTRKGASIRYGRVEVKAKIPTGDWIWPAIWMLPTNPVYGAWPRSGEIDIMEARGNGPRYPAQGINNVRGSLNWGPYPFLNGVAKTYGPWSRRRGGFNKEFHTYSLEWTEKWLRIYVDSRLQHMLEVKFDEDFFKRGQWPPTVELDGNMEVLENPWKNGTGNAAPFDQEFYLILNVAVGGTNGWFPDNLGDKPWVDGSNTAAREFWKAKDKWLPTWPSAPEERGMVVDSVKMWQMC